MLNRLFVSMGIIACTAMSATAAERFEVPAGIFGGTTYQFSFAVGEVMKTTNPNYELIPLETTGIPASILKSAEKPAGRVMAIGGLAFADALNGKKPFPKKMDTLKLIGFVTQNIQTLFTYDQSIKELKDMSGKRFITTGIMSTNGRLFWNILKRGIPNSDKMKPSYTNWSAIQSAMLDGTAEVSALGVTTSKSSAWTPVAAFAEITASRGIPHFISVPEELIKEAAKAEKVNYVPVLMPKDSIAKGVPAYDVMAWEDRLGLGAFADIPDDLAYTIAKILCEKQAEITKYTPAGKAMSVEVTVPNPAIFPDSVIHPGALRYYKEKGLR